MRNIVYLVIIFTLTATVAAHAQELIAVLPFTSIGVDEVSVETAYSLLRQEIARLGQYEPVPGSQVSRMLGPEPCTDVLCAAEIGRRVNADMAVFGSMNRLGEKVIVQYTVVDVASEKAVLADHITALSVEDLETVMKRVAMSITSRKPITETVEVGRVTQTESLRPRRRLTTYSSGVKFGYLYPVKGYDDHRVFVFDIQTLYETENFMVSGLFGIREGVVLNIGAYLLTTKTDFCPYLGGGLGFHWVSHGLISATEDEDKRGDGFEAMLSGGIMALRTYNIRLLLNMDYTITFNDYSDQGVVFTIGLMSSGSGFLDIF